MEKNVPMDDVIIVSKKVYENLKKDNETLRALVKRLENEIRYLIGTDPMGDY